MEKIKIFLSNLFKFLFLGIIVLMIISAIYDMFGNSFTYEEVKKYAETCGNYYDDCSEVMGYYGEDVEIQSIINKAYEEGFKSGVENAIDYVEYKKVDKQ